MSEMTVAIAHEWLVKYAGSERCVIEMAREFPGARILTTITDPSAMPPELRAAEPSALQRLPGASRVYQWLIPAMPLVWRLRPEVDDVDLLLSSSHACVKAVRVAEGIPHLCYCHTPMRYAWDFNSEKTRFPPAVRPVARLSARGLRTWDRRSSRTVTRFLANSNAVARRIADVYNREATVVHPPVDTTFFTPGGDRDDYFLFVGRFVSYKRADLVAEVFRGLGHRLVMVGDGHLLASLKAGAGRNITFVNDVTPERLRELYRGARALVFPAEEDFGIAMAEAQACGTPVIGLRAGGALDIVEEGVSGWFVDSPDITSVRRAVEIAAESDLDAAGISAHAQRFSAARFRREIRLAAEEVVAATGRGEW